MQLKLNLLLIECWRGHIKSPHPGDLAGSKGRKKRDPLAAVSEAAAPGDDLMEALEAGSSDDYSDLVSRLGLIAQACKGGLNSALLLGGCSPNSSQVDAPLVLDLGLSALHHF